MLGKTVKKLDVDASIGTVTLSDGVTVLNIPKLSVLKIIKIVKWLGIDGMKLYSKYEQIIADPEMNEAEKFAVILEELPEEQLVRLFSIALDLSDEEVLSLDINEMLAILIEYAEALDLNKTFTQVRELYKKIYKEELPDFKNLIPRIASAPITEQNSSTN